MTPQPERSLLTPTQLVDEYFVENRNRVLEVAAFLDRIDRADPAVAASDFRMQVFVDAIASLTTAGPDRLAHIQMLLSDPTTEPLAELDRKGAVGAFDRSLEGVRR
jgi:hypothetical protein